MTHSIHKASGVLSQVTHSSTSHRFSRRIEIMLPRLLLRPFDVRWPGVRVDASKPKSM